ncbi:MAG: hypothetical protein KW788_00340 [Candidatus Doudnabacteria bacterium]|nr:hypothetical protein [Candidatus Doudnabacteria bacterium]
MLKSITFVNLSAVCLLLLSSIGLGLIITKLDPGQTVHLLTFYLDILVLIGTLTYLIGYYMRQVFGVKEFAWRHVWISARQALWFSLMVLISLILLSYGLFNWLSAIFLGVCLVFLESYFLFK